MAWSCFKFLYEKVICMLFHTDNRFQDIRCALLFFTGYRYSVPPLKRSNEQEPCKMFLPENNSQRKLCSLGSKNSKFHSNFLNFTQNSLTVTMGLQKACQEMQLGTTSVLLYYFSSSRKIRSHWDHGQKPYINTTADNIITRNISLNKRKQY